MAIAAALVVVSYLGFLKLGGLQDFKLVGLRVLLLLIVSNLTDLSLVLLQLQIISPLLLLQVSEVLLSLGFLVGEVREIQLVCLT